MKKPTLYMMCGIPGSGKTTLAKVMLEQRPGLEYVSRDAIRFSLVDEKEDYFSKEPEVFDTFVSEIATSLCRGRDVIADATHITAKSRNRVLKCLSGLEYNLAYIVVDSPLEMCIANNNKRQGRERVPEAVIRQMYDNFERPIESDNIFTVKEGILQ